MPNKKSKSLNDLNVGRDYINGDEYNQFILQVGAFTPSPDLVQLRKDYLAHIERSFHALDFKGIPQLRNLTSELSLEEIYVPLMARPEIPEGETRERRLRAVLLIVPPFQKKR